MVFAFDRKPGNDNGLASVHGRTSRLVAQMAHVPTRINLCSSCQANCGVMNSGREVWLMTKANIALLQCQATVVGFLAAMVAVSVDFWSGDIKLDHALLMASASVITANLTSVCLSKFHSRACSTKRAREMCLQARS